MILPSVKEKFILGTVQLGLPYGINNQHGKPSEVEAFRILDFAYENNIRTLDTADGYGESIKVIGRYVSATQRKFNIINKFKVDSISISDKLFESLEILKTDSLHCYMYHQFSDYQSGGSRAELSELKNRKSLKKIGVSLYDIDQLRKVVDDTEVDVIQLPANLLDTSNEKEFLLKKAKASGKEIHVRSVYLQGLFFKDPVSLTGNLIALRPYLEKLKLVCHEHQLDVKSAALNFILKKEYIDFIVLGIDHVSQLADNLLAVNPAFDDSIFSEIEIHADDQYLLNPSNWKP